MTIKEAPAAPTPGALFSKMCPFFFLTRSAATFWRVSGAIHSRHKLKGARGSVICLAAECGAFYENQHGPSSSNVYEGTTLPFVFLFATDVEARQFSHKLTAYVAISPFSERPTIEFDKTTTTAAPADPTQVRLTDYKTGDSDSPPWTLAGQTVASTSVTVASYNAETAAQSLEKLLPYFRPYKCHLRSKRLRDEYTEHPDNMIYCSWTFHQYLDGLNTRDLETYEHDLPLIAIRYVSTEVGDIVPGRRKVIVAIECRVDVADHVLLLLREGSHRNGPNELVSFIFVRDVEVFKSCLEWKYADTKSKWAAVQARLSYDSDSGASGD